MAQNLIFLEFFFSNRERFRSLLSDLQLLENVASIPVESATVLKNFNEKVRSLDRSMQELVGDLLHHKCTKIFEYVKKEETQENQS